MYRFVILFTEFVIILPVYFQNILLRHVYAVISSINTMGNLMTSRDCAPLT